MKNTFWILVRFLVASSALSSVLGAVYQCNERIVGRDFYDAFNFEAIPDPTHGRVNYVNKTQAIIHNLTFASEHTFVLRADHKAVINNTGTMGRNSARIRTNKAYTTHVAVFDIVHMPQGCGTWPAVWETDEAIWPNGGEVDILEGVNDQGTDQVTLHTVTGCTMPTVRNQTGFEFTIPFFVRADIDYFLFSRRTSLFLDCDVNANFNAGCGVSVGQASSYGPTFNADGGGWYAIERTNASISVWFWSRKAEKVPFDVREGGREVNTGKWGIPVANFPNTNCNLDQFFDAHNIIINLTFCGDFAGNPSVYAASGCPSTCEDYVDNNPEAFTNAYFQFNSINIYEQRERD
ncbi:Glycoside hydrolase family 16 protein [Mycena venus]|uniref:Glycoside hydrolase family 16 protein n=1 Tax=Mycena venus TaxID=2733690 RepID=A0A8H6XRD5_9AGAR|nr:Glycoside hydrolase family 16 protein [Mycena venus]